MEMHLIMPLILQSIHKTEGGRQRALHSFSEI